MFQNVWTSHADDLAEWSLERAVNRTDCFGAYRNGQAFTPKITLTREHLQGHFIGKWTGGVHAISKNNTSLWVCLDIDSHHEADDRAAAEAYAQSVWFALNDLVLEPVLFSSDGNGSFHLYVFFEYPIPSEAAHEFGRWLVHECPPPTSGSLACCLGRWSLAGRGGNGRPYPED